MASVPHEEAHRRALQAAAKVALTMSAASVFGACGGSMAAEPPHTPQDDAGTDTSSVAVAEGTPDATTDATVVSDAVVSATACGPITTDAATPAQTACCAAKVRDTLPRTWVEPASGSAPAHPELVECCDEMVRAFDGTHDYGLTFDQAHACCFVLPPPWYSHGGIACTPWGPPMPPEMPGATTADDDEVRA